MHLTALQLPARFNAAQAQLQFAQTLLEAGPRTDLVLFPEASLTGYVSAAGDFDLSPFAEPLDGPTRAALAHLARRFDCLVVGPLIEEGCFNSLLGITPDGATLIHYRKRHPWFPETWATPGPGAGKVVTWRGKKLLPAICFDVHFLAVDASAQLRSADLVLFASAWVDEEDDARPPLLQALGLPVLNANWGPGRPALRGQGGSLFIDGSGALQSRLETPTGRLDVTLP